MARYDTTQLANTVIRDAKVPAGSSYRDNDNEKILAIATEEQEAVLVPELIKVQGGHLMAYADTTLTTSTIRYRLPERAIRPERVVVVNSAGALIARLPLASGDMVDEVLAGFTPRGDAIGYWAPENNHAVVALRDSVLQSGHSLRIYYRRQPNGLVATASCARTVTWPGDNSGAFTFATINAADALVTLVEGDLYDIIKQHVSFEAVAEGVTFQSLTPGVGVGETLDGFTSAQDIDSGDYIAPAGYTPVPQLPVAFHAVLAALTTARVLREMGNTRAADLGQLAADRKLQSALTTITPRGDDAETTVDEVWLTGG
jgi:hypothetical protein